LTRVSRLVDEIAAAGLVVREQNPQDGRSAYATLTAEGLKRYRKADRRISPRSSSTFSCTLDDEELRTVATVLQRVLAD
jgi:DNA-binding MarR family transcriptional regulator